MSVGMVAPTARPPFVPATRIWDNMTGTTMVEGHQEVEDPEEPEGPIDETLAKILP